MNQSSDRLGFQRILSDRSSSDPSSGAPSDAEVDLRLSERERRRAERRRAWGGRGPAEDFEVTEDSQTRQIDRRTVSLLGHRHGLKILGGFMVAMFVTVITMQVAC
jgi:hypothetical protein